MPVRRLRSASSGFRTGRARRSLLRAPAFRHRALFAARHWRGNGPHHLRLRRTEPAGRSRPVRVMIAGASALRAVVPPRPSWSSAGCPRAPWPLLPPDQRPACRRPPRRRRRTRAEGQWPPRPEWPRQPPRGSPAIATCPSLRSQRVTRARPVNPAGSPCAPTSLPRGDRPARACRPSSTDGCHRALSRTPSTARSCHGAPRIGANGRQPTRPTASYRSYRRCLDRRAASCRRKRTALLAEGGCRRCSYRKRAAGDFLYGRYREDRDIERAQKRQDAVDAAAIDAFAAQPDKVHRATPACRPERKAEAGTLGDLLVAATRSGTEGDPGKALVAPRTDA